MDLSRCREGGCISAASPFSPPIHLRLVTTVGFSFIVLLQIFCHVPGSGQRLTELAAALIAATPKR